MFRSALLLTAFATWLVPAAAGAETITYHATLSSAAEVPPNKTAGTGTVTATIDTDTKTLSYTVQYMGLSVRQGRGTSMGPLVWARTQRSLSQ